MTPLDRPIRVLVPIVLAATLAVASVADAQKPRRTDRRIGDRLVLPDLVPEVTQSSDVLAPGSRQVYTITVRNEGRSKSPPYRLETHLSQKLSPGNVEEVDGFECADRDLFATRGRNRHCRGRPLRPGESATFTVEGLLPKSAPSGQSIGFLVEVDPSDTVDETINHNNRASESAISYAREWTP